MKKCLVCSKKNFKLIWNDKIRRSAKKFTKNKEKIFQCTFCDLVFLDKKRKNLEDSSITRNIFNKNNSIKEFLKFHTPRERKKLNMIKKIVDLKNKRILESNCGAGVLINILKKESKLTAGLDSEFYRKYVEGKGHNFFSNINKINKSKMKFDIIFSLSEIEHKFDPISFLRKLKKVLAANGIIIIKFQILIMFI